VLCCAVLCCAVLCCAATVAAATLPCPISTVGQTIANQNSLVTRAVANMVATVGSWVMATSSAAVVITRGAGDKSQLDAWGCYAVHSLML